MADSGDSLELTLIHRELQALGRRYPDLRCVAVGLIDSPPSIWKTRPNGAWGVTGDEWWEILGTAHGQKRQWLHRGWLELADDKYEFCFYGEESDPVEVCAWCSMALANELGQRDVTNALMVFGAGPPTLDFLPDSRSKALGGAILKFWSLSSRLAALLGPHAPQLPRDYEFPWHWLECTFEATAAAIETLRELKIRRLPSNVFWASAAAMERLAPPDWQPPPWESSPEPDFRQDEVWPNVTPSIPAGRSLGASAKAPKRGGHWPRGHWVAGGGSGTERKPRRRLLTLESAVFESVDDQPRKGPEISKRSGYPYDQRLRACLAQLVREGILAKVEGRGYVRGPEAAIVVSDMSGTDESDRSE